MKSYFVVLLLCVKISYCCYKNGCLTASRVKVRVIRHISILTYRFAMAMDCELFRTDMRVGFVELIKFQ